MNNRRYQAPTVGKAFQILELVSRAAEGLKISELSQELGISKSTVHGIAAALEDAGALIRDSRTKRYSPGLTLFELGQRAYARFGLREVARPFMEALMTATAETVFLGVRNGDHVSILDSVESTQELKITSPIGTHIPLLAGATGKVFLASMAESEARTLVEACVEVSGGLKRYTSKTIVEPGRYLAELEAVRRRGYALDDEEYIRGVRAVAAPVRGEGRPSSAIWVVGFTPGMSATKMKAIALETRAAAEAISARVDALSSGRQERSA